MLVITPSSELLDYNPGRHSGFPRHRGV